MIQTQPFFSICIPTFNSVDLLDKLIQSLINQTFKNIEIIISDDSTNKEVCDFCKSLNDDRISYFKHKSIINPTENWNYSLKKAKGNYKILVHHDDYFSDNFTLEKIYNEYEKNGEFMVCFLSFIVENNFKKFYYGKFSIKQIFKRPEDLLYVNYFSSPSCLVLNQKVDLLYNEELKWLVDVDLYSRLFKKYFKIKLISNASMVIGMGNQRVTNTITKKDILREFYLLTQKKIYKYKLGIYFVQFMKLKVILSGYFNFKLSQISR
jgi:glycosyltransferase involved in cell wall biosynthesis